MNFMEAVKCRILAFIIAGAPLLFSGLIILSPLALGQDAPTISRKPALIRDTNIAEDKESEVEAVKEPDPARARENLQIGNMYYKKRNYPAAISRYLEAIAWQQDYTQAYEALARAYEKNGDLSKAIQTLQAVLEKNPDAAKGRGWRTKITELTKKNISGK